VDYESFYHIKQGAIIEWALVCFTHRAEVLAAVLPEKEAFLGKLDSDNPALSSLLISFSCRKSLERKGVDAHFVR
jgi:hypothetical protein